MMEPIKMISFKEFTKPKAQNDNFSRATNQKWKTWLKDNPGHPSAHKVAAQVQKGERQLDDQKKLRIKAV